MKLKLYTIAALGMETEWVAAQSLDVAIDIWRGVHGREKVLTKVEFYGTIDHVQGIAPHNGGPYR